MIGKTISHYRIVEILNARTLIWFTIGAFAFLIIAFISGSTPWDLTPHSFADLLITLSFGGIWGAIVGACFKGKENKGAIAFAIISSLRPYGTAGPYVVGVRVLVWQLIEGSILLEQKRSLRFQPK